LKKGRHRRYEEARALKQSDDSDLEQFIEGFNDDDDDDDMKPEHASWAAEFEADDED
jgi:hypothetical protein